MTNKFNVQVLKPFGPRMIKSKVPSEMVNMLNVYCDEITEMKDERLDASKNLVGHVKEEWYLDLERVPSFKDMLVTLVKVLDQYYLTERLVATGGMSLEEAKKYVKEQNSKNPTQVNFETAWFVRAFENDYNPTHQHTSMISCVLYLKVPEIISNTNNKNVTKKATEGFIDFLYGSTQPLSSGNLCVLPEVGDFYLFPGFLFHTAYPFYGPGERRSLSANIGLTSNLFALR
ncbi:uncharacterized protein METZ01_LOCUS397925 [marine metagenome]|uniref:JmjC domain-containing protein n=1 Tax=marine metagenome TaxID=408172 RepID=A0A382VGQ2_9ZZZZ